MQKKKDKNREPWYATNQNTGKEKKKAAPSLLVGQERGRLIYNEISGKGSLHFRLDSAETATFLCCLNRGTLVHFQTAAGMSRKGAKHSNY